MTICILNTSDLIKAQLTASLLEDNGILCELISNDASGMLPHLRAVQGVQLYIEKKDQEAAFKLLNEVS